MNLKKLGVIIFCCFLGGAIGSIYIVMKPMTFIEQQNKYREMVLDCWGKKNNFKLEEWTDQLSECGGFNDEVVSKLKEHCENGLYYIGVRCNDGRAEAIGVHISF